METAILTSTNTKWALDLSHSELMFRVKHLMISDVKGYFRSFSAEIQGENLMTSTIRASIDATSIFTNDASRDGHLKGPDFFDVEQYPEITFESTSFRKTDDENYILSGQLTMRGITRPVTLQAEFGGVNKDPWGNEKAAFAVHGKINRKDWGLNWNAALEAGGVLVSDDVRISAEIQLVKQS